MDMPPRPIGYYLRHLDRLAETGFARVLAGRGLTRRHWQVLNTLADAPGPRAEVVGRLDHFRDNVSGEGQADVDGVVADLIGRGWIAEDADGRCALTDAGRTAHAETAATVGAFRATMVGDVSTEEYLAAVDVLHRMSANLEAAAA